MPERLWKVGELAARTGLTVRTLHHYDRIGLLRPSGRTDSAHGSGHRLYTTADVARLQQVLSLKQLGFGLEQVRDYLARADYDPRAVVRLHLAKVREQAAELGKLGDRLAALDAVLDAAGAVSAEQFLDTIGRIAMLEKYYTPEQLENLRRRREEGGEAMEEAIRRGPQQWVRLHADVAAAMAEGVPPTHPRAHELARRWFGLVAAFTGGDPGILKSLKAMYQNEDTVRGMDVKAMRPMMEYVEKAASAAGLKLGG